MANNVYIGMRYVPIYMGAWDSSLSYGALCIVDYGNNTYTSKKPVPVGTLPTNTNYWALTGNYNGAIINLQNQIGDITSLKTLNKDTLVDAINSVHDHRYIFIGDSYGHASGSNNGWIDRLVPMLGLTADDYYDATMGGVGFRTADNNFLSLLQSLSASIADHSSITDIIVIGGTNDLYDTEENISDAIAAFNTYAYATYPNAKVKIGMCAATNNPSFVGIQYDRTLRGYANCGKAEFLNNLQYVFHDYSLINSDGIHPTNSGYAVLTNKIYEALNGGCTVNYYDTTDLIPRSGCNLAVTSKITVSVNNNITDINFGPRIGISAPDAAHQFAIQSATLLELGSLNSKYVKGIVNAANDAYNFLRTSCYALIHSARSSDYYTIHGEVVIYAGKIYFLTYDSVLSTTQAFTACDSIQVFPGTITANTMYA